jgi:hypothetical protein
MEIAYEINATVITASLARMGLDEKAVVNPRD